MSWVQWCWPCDLIGHLEQIAGCRHLGVVSWFGDPGLAGWFGPPGLVAGYGTVGVVSGFGDLGLVGWFGHPELIAWCGTGGRVAGGFQCRTLLQTLYNITVRESKCSVKKDNFQNLKT